MTDRKVTSDLDAWRLLPWLANDTLEGEELEQVLDQLKRSRRCREELLFLSELRNAVEMATEDRLEVPEGRLAGLMDRIDVHERAQNDSREPVHDPAPVGGPAALRVLAQAALVVLLTGAVWWLATGRTESVEAPPDPEFQTLSSERAPAGALDGTTAIHRLRVIPEAGLSEEELRGLVLDVGAEIVAGPSPAGVYTLGWTRSGWTSLDPGHTLDAIAASLRADARVALAEPVRGP